MDHEFKASLHYLREFLSSPQYVNKTTKPTEVQSLVKVKVHRQTPILVRQWAITSC